MDQSEQQNEFLGGAERGLNNNPARKWKNTYAKMSLICTAIALLGIVILTFKDLSFSSTTDHRKSMMETDVLVGINLIGLTFGFISIALKEKRGVGFYLGMVVNAAFPSAIVITVFKAIF